MKQNLLKLAVVTATVAVIVGGVVVAAVAGFTAGQTRGAAMATHGHWSCDETILEHLPKTLNINVTQIGQSTYQNSSFSRESTNRHLRLWAKFVF